MNTSLLVRLPSSVLSFSISAPFLRPITMPAARCVNQEPQLVARPLDLDRADARGLQLLAELSLELHVLDQELVIVASENQRERHGLFTPSRNPGKDGLFCPMLSFSNPLGLPYWPFSSWLPSLPWPLQQPSSWPQASVPRPWSLTRPAAASRSATEIIRASALRR